MLYLHASFATLLTLLVSAAAAQVSPFVVDVTDSARKSTAALWTDFNGDDNLDLVFGDGMGANGFYLGSGRGDLALIRVGVSSGPFTDGVFADLDNDGDADVAVGGLGGGAIALNNDNLFRPAFSSLGSYRDTRGIDAVDVNGDGRLDLFLARRFGAPNALLIWQNGRYIAQDGEHQSRANTNASCWADPDEDGDLDVYVANGGGEPDVLYLNERGTLKQVQVIQPASADASSTSCAWGDADGDGDMDVIVTSSGQQPTRLFLNERGTLFQASAVMFPQLRVDAFNASWGDVDNDGDLDLVIANRNEPLLLLFNTEQGFEPVDVGAEVTSGVFSVAAALGDMDRDGDLDLAVATGNADVNQRSLVFRNESPEANGWLAVSASGTDSNRDAVGTRIDAHVQIRGEARVIVREVQAHSSRRTQPGPVVHFGLGDASLVDSLVVQWPNGLRQTLLDVSTRQHIRLEEPANVSALGHGAEHATLSLRVAPVSSQGVVISHVSVSETGVVRLDALDLNGRRVWAESRFARTGDSLRYRWVLDGRVASGEYVIRATSKGKSVTERVTIVR